MSKDLAIAVIHGIGSQQRDYSLPMREEIDARVAGHGADSSRIAWGEILWAEITEQVLGDYLEEARRQADLNYFALRRFLVSTVGDAAAYQCIKRKESATYTRIHAVVRQVIEQLYADVGERDQPLVVMAHSLGGQIMCNFVWDLQQGSVSRAELSSFEQMKTLTAMITFGCNIPLFALAHDPPTPIEFPPQGLKPAWEAVAQWRNYYDPDDILAYPIKPLGGEYAAVVDLEEAINVGGIATSWNPMSHMGYWTDNDFTKPVAKYIASLLEVA